MDPAEARKIWESYPWHPFDSSPETTPISISTSTPKTTTPPLAWSKTRVPYVQNPNSLQTLDVHIPGPNQPSLDPPQTSSTSTSTSHVPPLWLIYIHGGAWRDPLVTSAALLPSLRLLLRHYPTTISQLAGVASLNYTLSPHPNHPPGSLPAYDEDPRSRTGEHPQHIRDVCAALGFLEAVVGGLGRYVLVGHSCGGTLALQTIMPHTWTTSPSSSFNLPFPPPTTIGPLAGLYDLPLLAHTPEPTHSPYNPIYRQFLTGAFGSSEEMWRIVSPACTLDASRERWKEGVWVVLGFSREDSLVPVGQVVRMGERFGMEDGKGEVVGKLGQSRGREGLGDEKREGWVECEIVAVEGDHDEMWNRGVILAGFLEKVLQGTVQRLNQ